VGVVVAVMTAILATVLLHRGEPGPPAGAVAASDPGPARTVGRLRVTQVQTACCYIEGQVSYLRLTSDGDIVFERDFRTLDATQPLVSEPLPSGPYRLGSWQRPCEASCPPVPDPTGELSANRGALGPPTDGCEAQVTVRPGHQLGVTVQFAPFRGCTVSVGKSAPTSSIPDVVALRAQYPGCGNDFGPGKLGAAPRRCLLSAYEQGLPAELAVFKPPNSNAPELRLYRVNADRSVEVFTHPADGSRWLRITCGSLAETNQALEARRCGTPKQLK